MDAYALTYVSLTPILVVRVVALVHHAQRLHHARAAVLRVGLVRPQPDCPNRLRPPNSAGLPVGPTLLRLHLRVCPSLEGGSRLRWPSGSRLRLPLVRISFRRSRSRLRVSFLSRLRVSILTQLQESGVSPLKEGVVIIIISIIKVKVKVIVIVVVVVVIKGRERETRVGLVRPQPAYG